MFASKLRKDAAFSLVLIVVMLFNALNPVTTFASSSSNQPTNTSTEGADISSGMAIGERNSYGNEEVQLLSEQIALEAQQPQEETLKFKVGAEPSIYTPNVPIRLHWKVQNLNISDLASAAIVIHAPEGVTPRGTDISYTPDGLVSVPVNETKAFVDWDVTPDVALPIYFTLDLLINDDLFTSQAVMIDQKEFSVEKSKGGKITSADGKVIVDVPVAALDESLDFAIRKPAPQEQPAISLTWQPIEIIAVGKDSKKNVDKFTAPVKITMKYDESQIFDWDENALSIYYYDQEMHDWFPITTTVDTVNNTLTAYSDHLTVFDHKANNWQSQSLPTVDDFKVSDFTGAGTYGLSIWTPPGPGGLQPALSLTYNSQVIDESSAFSQPSWVGMGWDLDTGAITRNMHGTDSNTSDDTFAISAGGVSGLLLPISTSGTITNYNTADQSFMKVQFESSTSTWTAWGTDGTKYEFASRAWTSRTDTDGCSTESELDLVWRWSLTSVTNPRVKNDSGIPIPLTYTYEIEKKSTTCRNEIAVYPLAISYPNGKYSISFEKELRNDYQDSWKSIDSKTLFGKQRLKKIYVQHNGATVRSYELEYAPDAATSNVIYPNFKWSRQNLTVKTLTLRGVQEFDANHSALPAVTFTYVDGLHLTDVNNGQGGTVHIDYERWGYPDDANDDLRSLMTVFGRVNGTHPECVIGNPIYGGTAWTKVSGGAFGCESGNPYAHLQLGYQVQGSPAVPTEARRSIPENVAKPGARYSLAIDGGSYAGVVDIRWGFRDLSTGEEDYQLWDNVQAQFNGFSIGRTVDFSVNLNPSQTYLYINCTDCKLAKVQFALHPQMWRVVSRTVTAQPTNLDSTYTYNYDNASPNTADNSAAASYGNDALYTKLLREFRGHAMSQVINPEGLATVNWFHQSDVLKGRAYDTLTMHIDRDSVEDFDDDNPADLPEWTPLPATSVPNPKTSGIYFGGPGYDWGLESYNTASNWNVSFARTTPSITSGEMVVAHVALGEDVGGETNAQGEVGLSNGGQFLGITFNSSTGTATASDGQVLLSSGKFKKDEWYGVMLFVDANNGSRIRIWQLDDPSNSGEVVVPGVGGGNWTFTNRVYDGALWLDSYFEGIPYSETLTTYETTVQYDTVEGNGVTDLPSLTNFKDLQIVWNKVASVEQRNYNGDAKFVGTMQRMSYDRADRYGNLIILSELAIDNGVWTPFRGVVYFYFPNNTSHITGLPARSVTLSCTQGVGDVSIAPGCDYAMLSGKMAETYYFYDDATAYTTPPSAGVLTRQRTWVQGDDYSQTSLTYYPNGNLKDQIVYTGYATAAQTNDPSGPQTTTTSYDTAGYNTYPVSITNALGQVTQTGYNFALGLPISVTDANNVTTSATYDGFGRMRTITAPGDLSPTLTVDYFNYNSATQAPFQVNLTQRVDAGATIRLSRFYDGAGRQIQTQTVGAVVNGTQKNVVVDFLYNGAGMLVQQSIPNVINYNGAPVYVAQNFAQYTATTYDVLGRTRFVTQPNTNVVEYLYGDLTTTVKDPKGISTTTTSDIWGRTTLVDAPEGPDVSYTYDVLNNLKTATRGGVMTIISYDGVGRKLNMNDPDMGFWQYQYDALGNLKFQTDNRGCVMALDYDDLNRLTNKTSSGEGCSVQVNNTYGYDDTANGNKGIGRRTSMSDGSGSTVWKYDNRGRVLEEVKTITGAVDPFTTAWTYNNADLPVTMTYPGDAEVLTYAYNSDGSLDTVTSSTGGTYLADTQYDEAGRIKSMDYGSSVMRKTFNYFPWDAEDQGGLLNTAVTTRLSDQVTLQSFAYTYDENANVSTITDNTAGPQTQTFGYDSLNRLTSADVTGGTDGLYSESYEYNPTTGNLSLKAGVSYAYDTNHPHAVQSLSNGNSYEYDANGNMTLRNVGALTFDLAYDAENRLVSVTDVTGMGMALPQVPAYAGDPLPDNEAGTGHFVNYNPQPMQQSSFPSTSVLDDFNRADGSIGGNWSGETGETSVSSNQLLANSNDTPISWNAASFGADQEAFVTFSSLNTAGASEQTLILKGQGNGNMDDSRLEISYFPAQDRVVVWTHLSGQSWVQYGSDITATFNNGDQFGARALADGTVEVYKNGSVIATRSISSWTYAAQGGYIGLGFYNAQGAVEDDFGGGTLSSSATSTPTPTVTGAATVTATSTTVNTPTHTPAVTATITKTKKPSSTPTGMGTATPSSTAAFTPTHTATPTATRTATPSSTSVFTPTHTATPTATATSATSTPTIPPVPEFSHAAFTYDGDGRRVKSEISTNIATSTSYFVGNYYEVADGVVTKYYYAGSQRIAMRQNGTLSYLLGDHLGSTSLVTDGSGNNPIVTMYKAWGEVRYSSASLPTNYTYTGQYSYASDFGLHFYNARWYDSSLGRFAQADTVMPGCIQGLDRYAYVNNNHLRYTDPTGHKTCEDVDSNGKCTGDKLARLLDYVHNNILNNKGELKEKHKDDVLHAMELVVKKAASIYGKDWNGFLDATTYIFTGYYGHGHEAMWEAHQSDFDGYFDGDSGFHSDFVDGSNQVRHFWAAFATTANPTGDNPFGVWAAGLGNDWHDLVQDWLGYKDTTVIDYALSVTAINLAGQAGSDAMQTPTDLANGLEYSLGTEGSGSNGFLQLLERMAELGLWRTPHK